MTHCAKCGAELIGHKKFCAACGAPATDPRAAGAPSSSPGDEGVNPFAQTAVPGKDAVNDAYGPPPSAGPAPPVSPLAVSNVLSQRGAFDAAAGATAVAAARPPEPPKRMPGTQIMPSTANPAPSIAASAKGGAPRTAPMPSVPGSQPPGSVPRQPAAPPASQVAPASAPASRMSPGSAFRPMSGTPSSAAPLPAPHAGVGPRPPPSAQQPRGWNAPQQPYPQPPRSFGYAPGARVRVTWSNGQRYPGTLQQVSGTQCLVVFPDGQQHWVQMQYVAPG